MNEKNCCPNCKNLKVIISQGGNYRCYKKDVYIDYDFYENCPDFEKDERTLREKEQIVWG